MTTIRHVSALGVAIVLTWAAWRPALAQELVTAGQTVYRTWTGPRTTPEIDKLSWSQAKSRLEPLCQKATSARDRGDHADAANLFLDLAGALPESPQTMSALLQAAGELSHCGRVNEAKGLFDDIITLGRKLTVFDYVLSPKHQNRPPRRHSSNASIRDLMKRSLADKISLCVQAQDKEGALTTIGLYRAEFPEYPDLRQVLPAQALLAKTDGRQLAEQEAAAWRLSDQAKAAWRVGDGASAHELAGNVLKQYPSTAAALLVLDLDAVILTREKRHDEARMRFVELLKRVGVISPDSKLARRASSQIAYQDASKLYHELINGKQGWPVPRQSYEQLADMCYEVMAKHSDPLSRTTMHALMISCLFATGDLEAVVEEESKLFNEITTEKVMSDAEFKAVLLEARGSAIQALANLNRPQEALTKVEWSLAELHKPPAFRERGQRSLLEYSLFMKCNLLSTTEAPRTSVEAAAEEVIRTCTRSAYVERAQRILREAASRPAP